MKMLKKIGVLLIALTLSLSFVSCNKKTAKSDEKIVAIVPTDVIASVNGVEISGEALSEEMVFVENLLASQYGEDYATNPEAISFYNEQKDAAINYLVENEVALQEAKKMGFSVSEEEIEKQYKLVANDMGGEEALKQQLEKDGFSVDSYRKYISEKLLTNLLVDSVVKDVALSEEEISAFYENTKEDYTVQAGAHMYHILVDTEDLAKEIKKKYEEGTSFEDLASQYGTDGTKDTGGKLGFVTYEDSQYDEDFLAAAKQLGEGEVSDPVKTQFGWHIIKVKDIQKDDYVRTLEEVHDIVLQKAKNQKQFEVFNTYLSELKSTYDIKVND